MGNNIQSALSGGDLLSPIKGRDDESKQSRSVSRGRPQTASNTLSKKAEILSPALKKG